MADVIEFSEVGEHPTALEVALVASCGACKGDGAWEMVASRLAGELGPVAAARALAVVFDELGSEKVHIPRRLRFFSGLWAESRRDWAVDRMMIDNWSLEEVAAVLKISPGRVSQIVDRKYRTKLNQPG